MIRFFFLGYLALIACVYPASAGERLNVVATFSILGDFVSTVGGDRVIVDTLVGPNADTHTYTPKPTDVKKLAAARIVFVNGLGFESWLDRLISDSAIKAKVAVVTRGITAIDARSGQPNPHAWQSVPNAKVYVANIRDTLIAADPGAAEIYTANAAAYMKELDRLHADIREGLAPIPEAQRNFATPHAAFAYFGEAYGVNFHPLQGMNHEAEVSAKAMADLVMSIRRQQISAIFFENAGDPRLMQQIARETGIKIGGPLYSDSLTLKDGAAPTYLAMMRQNVRAMSSVFSKPN